MDFDFFIISRRRFCTGDGAFFKQVIYNWLGNGYIAKINKNITHDDRGWSLVQHIMSVWQVTFYNILPFS